MSVEKNKPFLVSHTILVIFSSSKSTSSLVWYWGRTVYKHVLYTQKNMEFNETNLKHTHTHTHTVYIYIYMKKTQGIQKMILFIVELFWWCKHFSFYINLSLGHLYMWCYIFWILFKSNFLQNETKEWESFKHSLSESCILFQNFMM